MVIPESALSKHGQARYEPVCQHVCPGSTPALSCSGKCAGHHGTLAASELVLGEQAAGGALQPFCLLSTTQPWPAFARSARV